MLSSDSRASSLLRSSASRKLATDRDMNMTLWKNYVVMACCIALPSHATATVVNADYRCVTPELTAMLVCDMTQLLLDLLEANLVYTHAHTHTHTHTHKPFTALLDFVHDCLGELVPES